MSDDDGEFDRIATFAAAVEFATAEFREATQAATGEQKNVAAEVTASMQATATNFRWLIMVTAFAAVLIPVVLLFLAAVQMRNFRREIESLEREKQMLADGVEQQKKAYIARERELGGLRFYKREDGKFTLTVPDANAKAGIGMVDGRLFVVEWQAP